MVSSLLLRARAWSGYFYAEVIHMDSFLSNNHIQWNTELIAKRRKSACIITSLGEDVLVTFQRSCRAEYRSNPFKTEKHRLVEFQVNKPLTIFHF
jgi:hypothetical protein